MTTKNIDLRVTRMNPETFEYDTVVLEGKTTLDCLKEFTDGLLESADLDWTECEIDEISPGNYIHFRELFRGNDTFHIEFEYIN